MLLQLFLYFSVQIETENYKLIHDSQLHLVHFMTNFELQLQEANKIFQFFLTSAC